MQGDFPHDRRTRAKRLADHIRGRRSVGNNLHWQLERSFREDERRIRKDHGAENLSRLCRIALNLLKLEDTARAGIAAKRKMDDKCLLKVVGG